MKNALQMLFAVALVSLLGWAIYLGVRETGAYFRSLNSDVAKAVVAGAAAVLGSVVTVTIGKAYETKVTTIRDLRTKKAPVYEKVVQGVFKMFFSSILGESPPSQSEIMKFLTETTESLTVWGATDVVKAFGRFKVGSTNPKETFAAFENLLFAIRADLGHSAKLPPGSILRLFITDYDEHMKKDSLKLT